MFRVIYTKPGHIAPRWADFRYREAAEVMRDIARDAGAEDAEVVEIGGDGDSEPSVAVSSEFQPSGVVPGAEGDE